MCHSTRQFYFRSTAKGSNRFDGIANIGFYAFGKLLVVMRLFLRTGAYLKFYVVVNQISQINPEVNHLLAKVIVI
jgi:hypothetical protein